jgi:hypothetical protein
VKPRGGHSRVDQGSRSKDRDQDRGRDQLVATSNSNSLVYQTVPYGFCSPRPEATDEEYRAQNSSSTSLVSSGPHAQLEEEDPVNEGTKDEAGSG